jgi:protein-S-isoprenylcysteine O-methyltransferase Ste14
MSLLIFEFVFPIIILCLSIVEYIILDYTRRINAQLVHQKENFPMNRCKIHILSISPFFQIFLPQWLFPAAHLFNPELVKFFLLPTVLNEVDYLVYVRYIAFGLFCYCQFIYFTSLWVVGKFRTPALQPPLKNPILVSHGIYRRIRHPLYSIAFVKFCCLGFYWSSAILLLGLPGFFILHQLAALEEKWLVDKLPAYQAYLYSTRKYWFFV